jgi:hypothetical protein
MNVSEKTIEIIELLKRRPRMILTGDVDFYSIKCFLIGYIQGVEAFYRIDLHKQISHWFQKKVNQKSSLFWTEHVSFYYKGKTDEELTTCFLEELKSFFLENTSIVS